MLNTIISKDKELFLFLNNLGNEQWDAFWLFLTSKYTFIPLYLLLLVILYKKKGVKKASLFLLIGILLITSSDQLANFFKFGFQRMRPCYEEGVNNLMRLVKSSCGGKFSYFSAHASTGMALAIFFGLEYKFIYKKLIYFLISIAFLVGYSRIYIGVHYPLDVITGFIIGTMLAILFYMFFQYLQKRFVN